MSKLKKKIAIAESCTGGLLMATLTEEPGASEYLLGGVVAYSNELKEKLLHVSKKTLEDHGAVSKETVIEMCEGLLKVTSAELAIAVSGIFGPTGGTPEKPVGTVWMAISERGSAPKATLIPLEKNLTRNQYREKVVTYLREALWNQ
jgi:PncC family amidohydrolase